MRSCYICLAYPRGMQEITCWCTVECVLWGFTADGRGPRSNRGYGLIFRLLPMLIMIQTEEVV